MDFRKLANSARRLAEEWPIGDSLSKLAGAGAGADAVARARALLGEQSMDRIGAALGLDGDPGETTLAARAGELFRLATDNATEISDRTAERIAQIYTEFSGRETDAEQVKRVAVQVGVAALVAYVTGSLLRGVEEGNGFADSPSSGPGNDAGNGFDNSFEGQAYAFFADKGGLNIETQVVDQDGCIL